MYFSFTALEVLLCCGSHFDCVVTAVVVFWRGGNDGMSGRDSNGSKPVLSEAAGHGFVFYQQR